MRNITPRMMQLFSTESAVLEPEKYRDFFNFQESSGEPGAGYSPVSGVVSHHTLTGGLLYNYYSRLSDICSRRCNRNSISNIIIIGPDHFLSARYSGIALTTRDFSWNSYPVRTNRLTVNRWLKELALSADHRPFYSEHSILTQVPFVLQFFPGARVIPVILHPHADMQKLVQLSGLVRDFLTANRQSSLVIMSIDFCHDVSRDETDARDRKNMGVLSRLEKTYPLGLSCDSPNTWYVVMNALNSPELYTQFVFHTDNEKYTGETQDFITSYFFSIIYGRN